MTFRQKNDHSSKSVCSFNTGPFFLDSFGEELSRNVFVVSVYAFEKKFGGRKDFLVTPKKSRRSWKFDFSRNSLGSFQEASRMCRVCPGVFVSVQELILACLKLTWIFRNFRHFWHAWWHFRLFSSCWLSFKSRCSISIRVKSMRIRVTRKRRLYGPLAR